MDFADIAARYAQTRWDQATQPFTDPEKYMEDRFGNATPKSTTINYNEDGTQTITNKVDVTPGQTAPQTQPAPVAQPTFTFGQQQPPVQAQPVTPVTPVPTPMPQPAPTPAPQMVQTGAMPTAKTPNMAPNGTWNDFQDQSQLPPEARMPEPTVQPAPQAQPQPAPAVQPAPVAGPAVPTPVNQPAPVVSTAPQVAAPQPVTPPAAPQPPKQIAEGGWQQKLSDAGLDKTSLIALANNPDVPEEGKRAIYKQLENSFRVEKEKAYAEDVIRRIAEGDPKAVNELSRLQRKKSAEGTEEGSYLKAILFSRLGLNDLSKQEQEKLGANNVFQRVIDPRTGESYSVRFTPDGEARGAVDVNGRELTKEELRDLNGLGGGFLKSAHPGQQRIRDSQGTEWSVVQSVAGPIFYNNQGVRGTPAGKTTPIQGGTEYIGQLAIEHNKKVAQYVAEYGADAAIKAGAQWMNPISGDLQGVSKNGFNPYLPGGTMKPGAGAPQVPPAPVAPPAAAPAPVTKKPVSYEGPVAPGEQAPTMQPAVYKPEPAGNVVWSDIQGQEVPLRSTLPGGMTTVALKDLETQQKLTQKGGETAIEVGGARSKKYNEYLDENVAPDAKNGYEIGQLRRKQFGVFNRPGVDTDKIFGLYNAAGERPGDQKLAIVRDIIGGTFKDQIEVSKRLAELNLDPATRSALEEYNILNADINRRTLKQTAGAGSVSDAEQDANRKSNVDPGKIPALGGYNSMAQSQFNGDLATYKGDWAADQKFTNTLQLEKAWRKESSKMADMYRKIAEERIKFINENGNTTGAVKEGYKRFPVPEYDSNTGTWKKIKPLSQILGQ